MSKIIVIKGAVSNDPLGLCPLVKLLEGGNLFFERGPVRTVRAQIKQVSPQVYIVISTGDEIRGAVLHLPFEIVADGRCHRIGWKQR